MKARTGLAPMTSVRDESWEHDEPAGLGAAYLILSLFGLLGFIAGLVVGLTV